MKIDKEQRYFADLRAAKDGVPRLSGYAAVFDSPSEDLGFRETIKRGAFSGTLSRRPDVRLLVNHDGLPLARTTSGTLRLSEDEIGLRFDAELDPADPEALSVLAKVRRGDLTQMSFAFRVEQNGQLWNKGRTERTLTALDLEDGDISCVTYPAYKSASVVARSRELALQSIQDSSDLQNLRHGTASMAVLRAKYLL